MAKLEIVERGSSPHTQKFSCFDVGELMLHGGRIGMKIMGGYSNFVFLDSGANIRVEEDVFVTPVVATLTYEKI